MNLQIGVKEVYTKNVTQTHNYKENVFFLLFLQLQLLKKKTLCTEKRAWWQDRNKCTVSQQAFSEASGNEERGPFLCLSAATY